MKALILVGGFGTRLRPLTFSKPKPLVDFCNTPLILLQIQALASVGVTDIVLAVNYQPQAMLDAMAQVESTYRVKVSFSIETEPLGTAGPLALASSILAKDDSPFFVLNSDVVCEFPFQELLAFHTAHGGEGTLLTTPVDDPSKYGVVLTSSPTSSQIDRFVEKPKHYVGNQINAGIYIFNPSILSRIQPVPTSIEKDVFPLMARDAQLHAMPLQGFWADVGQPKDFLTGTSLYLASLASKSASSLATTSPSSDNYTIIGNVLIHPSARIGPGCKIGPNVVLGPDTVIGSGVRLADAVIMSNSTISNNAMVKHSIVGWSSRVGQWARLDRITVLGEDVSIADEICLNGACVLPHKSVSENIMEPRIVM
ncbi:nucleotide-diphospho-sugar transferase [Phlyctochytrium arcticum]|nr:nucleotide-diphospho-sugar transferase [Phlyctochytrium arcticum]